MFNNLSQFKSPKIIALLVGLSMFLLLATITYYGRSRDSSTPQSQPNIPTLYQDKLNITSNLNSKDFKFPNELPTIELSIEPINQETLNKIAQSLKFEADPIIAQDTEFGTTYIYSNSSAALTAYTKLAKLDYQLSELPRSLNKQLSSSAVKEIALNFLSENGIFSKEDLTQTQISYLGEDASGRLVPTNSSNAQIIQVNLSVNTAQYPLLALSAQSSPISVSILPDGVVWGFSVVKLSAKKQETLVKIKSFNELTSSLENSKIISLDNGNINILDLPKNSIEGVTVNKADLYYLLDKETSSLLYPVFKLGGTAKITGSAADIPIELYLSATN